MGKFIHPPFFAKWPIPLEGGLGERSRLSSRPARRFRRLGGSSFGARMSGTQDHIGEDRVSPIFGKHAASGPSSASPLRRLRHCFQQRAKNRVDGFSRSERPGDVRVERNHAATFLVTRCKPIGPRLAVIQAILPAQTWSGPFCLLIGTGFLHGSAVLSSSRAVRR